jgi:hypothetical protein
VACSPGTISLVVDPTAESALPYFPARGTSGDELRFHASNTARVDASIAVALRCCAEHFGRSLRIPVRVVEPPADLPVHRELDALLGTDLPKEFEMPSPDGATAGAPPAVILPAVRIESFDLADELTRRIVQPLGEHYGRTAMRYLAGSFAALVENGLQHATHSTVGVVAAIAFDRHADQLRLVVADAGDGLAGAAESEEAMLAALEHSEGRDGGLDDLRGRARREGLQVQATVASGIARARTEGGGMWALGAGEQIDGFAVIVNVAAH